MQIIDNRALLLKLRNPGRVTNVIPKSKVLPTGEVLVSWGLEEARVLKNLQIKNVPSPIMGKYEWPGMYKPFDHQRTTASFLTLHKRAFCFSEQGCVDASTEYLSPTGWRRMDEYDGGQVAQYHPDTQRVEFVEPTEYVKLPCERMLRLIGPGVDQLLSKEHRVLVYSGTTGEPHVFQAVHLASGQVGSHDLHLPIGDDYTSRVPLAACRWTGEPSPDGFKYCFMVPSTFLVFRRNGCVFASGNTGKSASVIWASDYLLNIKAIKRVLIVCPVSVMQAAWVNDLFTFAMHRTVAVAHGYNKQARIKAIQSGAEYVVINYDGLAIVADEIKKGGFDLIVADEASALKTATTKRWKTFHSLLTPDTWLWLLTGTPAAQSPVDAYGLAKLVNPSGTPKFFNAFKDMVMTKITNFKWIPKPDAERTVHTLLQPAIRFTKEECLDLPEVTYTTRQVVLTPQQEKYYEMVRKSMRASAAGEQITAVNAATCINKLLQISCGSAYTDTGEVVEFDASSRLSALKEVIDEASHKVLVFVPFRHTIDVVHDYLSKNGITNEVINGGVPSNRRNEIFTDFQAKKDPQVLVIQPQAAAHGVTLTAANVVVWFAPTTSVETYLQANARTHRAGQRNPCTVVHLQGSPVEKRMYAMLQNNVDTHTKIVDLYKNVLDGDES